MLFGNAITVPAGYLLASQGRVDWLGLALVFSGTTLIIASACVLNNFLDQDIDSRMERTRQRPLISGEISGKAAVLFSILLGLVGFGVLLAFVHPLVLLIGIIGYIDYVWLYGAWSKRKSIHGTLVGSISGATPILAGYVAASQQIDLGALLVFAVLFIWQMPEFYSIAIFRLPEYKAANVPVISVIKGIEYTKRQIVLYTVAFVICSLLLTVFGYTGFTYTLVMGVIGGYWLWMATFGQNNNNNDKWAKKMFHISLYALLLFCFLLSIEAYMP